MLLKYLDIQGFKSFPDKTKVTFGKGLTAVVGPNGSGKSNISDAVRWVMGEQSTKTLRGSKMEDVIFAGTKTRKSQGFAEVSLTVDNRNREFPINSDEICITRRYDRSGESEYMINHNPVRLKDLQEMFMDTGLGKDGYCIVGQGRISEIVQSKSNERREIFEEAAGIAKFRYRKNEAERNLQHAEENLVRLRDILSELEVRVEPLREQSEKANKFIELSKQKKTLEISLWIDTIERSNQALKDQGDKILVCSSQRDDIENQIQEVEAQIQKAFEDIQNSLVSIDNMRREKDLTESSISELNSKIAVCKNNIEHNEQSIERIKSEIENNAKSFETINAEIDIKKSKIDEIQQSVQQTETLIASKQGELLAKSGETEDFSQREKELSDELNSLLLEQSKLKMTIANAKSSFDELSQTIERNQADEKQKHIEIQKYKDELAQANSFNDELSQKAVSLNNTYSGHKIKLDNRKQKLESIKAEFEKISLEKKEKEQKCKLIEAMEQSLDGFAFSVKEVIKKSKNGSLKGIYGTVSQLIEVNEEYSTAIETALGGAMQNIIVASESDAKAAIRELKQENLGRATFLPVTSMEGSSLNVSGLDRYAGYIDIASSLVSCDEKYRNVIGSLLSKTVIVEDIDTAVIIAQKNNYKFKIVTLDGQVVNAGGSLTGGSKNKGQSFLSRKNEIAMLKKEISDLSLRLTKGQATLAEISEDVSKIEAEYQAVASEMTTLNEDKIRVEGECKRIEHLLLSSTSVADDMSKELELKKLKQKQLQECEKECSQKLIELEQQASEKSDLLNSLQQSNQSLIGVKKALADEISDLNINCIGLKKDIEGLENSIAELERTKENADSKYNLFMQEISTLETDNANIVIEIEKTTDEINVKRQEIETFNLKIEQTIQARQEFEGKTTILRKDERALSEQKEKFSSEVARLEEKKCQIQKEYDEIISKLWDEYEMTRSEAQAIATKIDNVNKTATELNSIRLKIRSLGNVNVAAIEEYKEVSERYEFLNSQIKDVEKSRNELLKLINELTQNMESIFSENFEKINSNFQKIFVDLFGGGRASLSLTNPENLLESGIDIFVEPPGKIIKNLAALSGGEQAFVAIAIYFAILKVRPAPFCILDEIEAALDDVNVDKYASYLRTMSDKTQFIMITHRRGSMEVADVLYGVTMQDEGVSKLLELKVSEIENKLSLKI